MKPAHWTRRTHLFRPDRCPIADETDRIKLHVWTVPGKTTIKISRNRDLGGKGRNVIILLTGASHTGKTLLAQRMLEKYKYPYLSIDHLKMGLIRSGNTELGPEDDNALTEYLWPIVREMIKTVVENRQNLVVEGCYIPADWRNDFDAHYLPSIRFICLAMTEEYIDSHYHEIIGHESDIESRLIEADCTPDDLKECNRWYIETFGSVGEKVILIEDDYNKALTELIE